eukprot:jgi/Antlo1/1435/111
MVRILHYDSLVCFSTPEDFLFLDTRQRTCNQMSILYVSVMTSNQENEADP